jgi:hypothetical protein
MNIQQIIALLIVGVAAAYLIRNAVRTLRAFLSGKSGCASGCGKCGLAGEIASRRKSAPSPRPDVIPLTDIRSLPDKRR